MGVVTLSTVDFMAYLLSMHDHVKIPLKVDNKMDALSLIDLILYVSFHTMQFVKLTFFQLLDHNLLCVTKSREGNHRARRLMIKLGLKVNTVPQSALIHKDDVKIMGSNLRMGCGAISNVYQGSYRGNRVAVKRLSCPVGHQVGKHHQLEQLSYLSLVRISTRSPSSEKYLPGELFLMTACCPTSGLTRTPGLCT